MDRETAWAIYFAGVVSIQLHPKNVQELTPHNTENILQHAYDVANRMIALHEDRWGITEATQKWPG